MTVLLAVLTVGLGSLFFRLAPLLSTGRMPEKLTQAAGWAGLAVVAGISVRSVVLFQDSSTPGAPVVAAVSVAVGLVLAFRGRSLLVAVGLGGATYLLISAALAALA
jgi:branched-subunit amino acid transport protein